MPAAHARSANPADTPSESRLPAGFSPGQPALDAAETAPQRGCSRNRCPPSSSAAPALRRSRMNRAARFRRAGKAPVSRSASRTGRAPPSCLCRKTAGGCAAPDAAARAESAKAGSSVPAAGAAERPARPPPACTKGGAAVIQRRTAPASRRCAPDLRRESAGQSAHVPSLSAARLPRADEQAHSPASPAACAARAILAIPPRRKSIATSIRSPARPAA